MKPAIELALLVAPRSPAALAEALLAVAMDATTRERLIPAGLERARSFSWQHSGHELAALYRFLATARA